MMTYGDGLSDVNINKLVDHHYKNSTDKAQRKKHIFTFVDKHRDEYIDRKIREAYVNGKA